MTSNSEEGQLKPAGVPLSEADRMKSMCAKLAASFEGVEDAEAALKAAKDRLNRLQLEDVPQLMIEVGVVDFVTDDGYHVTLSEEVKASITNANAPGAHKWLTDNGFGGLIKTFVGVPFAASERDSALALREQLEADKYDPELTERVHPSTLKAFVKERLEAGDEIPFDLFSIHPFNKAKLKRKA